MNVQFDLNKLLWPIDMHGRRCSESNYARFHYISVVICALLIKHFEQVLRDFVIKNRLFKRRAPITSQFIHLLAFKNKLDRHSCEWNKSRKLKQLRSTMSRQFHCFDSMFRFVITNFCRLQSETISRIVVRMETSASRSHAENQCFKKHKSLKCDKLFSVSLQALAR